jgi:F-type H+-transporting ATPase subunit epsilon
VTLNVALVVPDRELWAGEARTVIAKTTEGDIGVLRGHSPMFGILAEGSLVEILPPDSDPDRPVLRAAVSGGFLSVADDKVSVLAAQALLSDDVDVSAARQALDEAPLSDDESPEAKYARAQLRLAGDQA